MNSREQTSAASTNRLEQTSAVGPQAENAPDGRRHGPSAGKGATPRRRRALERAAPTPDNSSPTPFTRRGDTAAVRLRVGVALIAGTRAVTAGSRTLDLRTHRQPGWPGWARVVRLARGDRVVADQADDRWIAPPDPRLS
jgi:hypothetical protein